MFVPDGCCCLLDSLQNQLELCKPIFYVRMILNSHNSHVWPAANPYATSVHKQQQRLTVNVWASTVHEVLFGPYLLTRTAVCTDLLGFSGGKATRHMRFQHDWAAGHLAR
jgi:hypothetical protein